MLSMLSFGAPSVNSCPNFDVFSWPGILLMMLLLRGGMVGGGEGGSAEENRLSAMVNGEYR